MFKITSKILVNRFQEVLYLCIDEAQSAIVPSCLISDNIGLLMRFFTLLKIGGWVRKGFLR